MSVQTTSQPAQSLATPSNLVEVKHLVKYFPVRGGIFRNVKAWVKAVDDVSFVVKEGETLGLVGELGCGKTTVGRTMLRLIEPTSGEVLFNNENILNFKRQRAEKNAP